ncbi:GNAT family N-acetyltransferase [Furfurilactobacillus milii]|uniref:GNAT family N-acetyltransferase n=1 Tax=Furfurilactobacillus milii TaxID=2888272 RepID=UPI001F3590F0|nr:GNAT family N-acetyltransferase [Furfurilactobacillus milii]MCF6418411.1 GNAT family N-acetyltransferase [Furfurilactobacillus milii]
MTTGVTVRTYRPGEPSLVVNFYYRLFSNQFHFLPNTEHYFLHAMTELYDQPKGNELWIAEEDGNIVGSICVIGKKDGTGQIRLFGTDPSVQGKGVGSKLMSTAMAFCKQHEYRHVYLWTIDICEAAVHLYKKFGFKLTDTKPNDTWADYHMTEELMEFNQ